MKHTPEKWNPTQGCQKAAEIIMNGKERIKTGYGEKTQMGIADLIYRETEIYGLLAACKVALQFISIVSGHTNGDMAEQIKEAIAKAEGATT